MTMITIIASLFTFMYGMMIATIILIYVKMAHSANILNLWAKSIQESGQKISINIINYILTIQQRCYS
jgi:hypothetical protein